MIIYTDGSCRKGEGGYGIIIEWAPNIIEVLGCFQNDTTCNQMELLGPIKALQSVWEMEISREVLVISDSEYFVKGFNTWMHKWQANGWRLNGTRPAKNLHFWQQLWRLKNKLNKEVKAKWVKGHANHPENNLCDKIAGYCRDKKTTININFKSKQEMHDHYERYFRPA